MFFVASCRAWPWSESDPHPAANATSTSTTSPPSSTLTLLTRASSLLQRVGNNSHDATRRRLAHCPEAYSSKCLEEEFSEVRRSKLPPREGPQPIVEASGPCQGRGPGRLSCGLTLCYAPITQDRSRTHLVVPAHVSPDQSGWGVAASARA